MENGVEFYNCVSVRKKHAFLRVVRLKWLVRLCCFCFKVSILLPANQQAVKASEGLSNASALQ